MLALVFPGQGSQFIGMGKELYAAFPEAKEVFQEADDTLGQSLSELMFHGDESELNLTANTQPALLTMSTAVARVLQKAKPELFSQEKTKYIAGHSLGEYSALTAGGVFALSDAVKLVRIRGEAMQEAVPVGVGAMAAIIGLTPADLIEATEAASNENFKVSVANDNSSGQVVISGHKEAVEKAIEICKEKGAKRAIPLPVSAPFHSALMQPAADTMKEALANVTLNKPFAPVVANVIASDVSDPERIRDLLVQQVTGQVRWRESVQFMAHHGVTQLAELGAGKVLSGLTRRIEKDLTSTSIGTPEEIDAFLKTL